MRNIKSTLSSFVYANSLAWKTCKKYLSFLMTIKLILAGLPILLIWCTQQLIDSINFFITYNGTILDTVVFFTLEVSIILGTLFFQKVSVIIEQKITYEFGLKYKLILFRKQRSLSFDLFENHKFQDKLNRLNTNDSNMINMSKDGIDFLSNTLSIIGIFAYLTTISWLFVPIILVGLIPLFIVQFKFGRKKYELFKSLTPFGRKEHYVEKLLSTPASLSEIKLYSLEENLIKKWSDYYKLSSTRNIEMVISQNKWLMLTQIIQMITYMVTGFIAIMLMIQGRVLVGSFVAILQSVQRIQGTFNNITNSLSSIYESSFIINDFRSFLELKEIDNNSKEKIEHVNNLEVTGLSFKYPNSNKFALEDISINIPKGRKVAIIGVNGSGKTTLLKCLTGLYYTENAVKVNHKKLEELDLESYRNRLAVLTQGYNKYEFSVKENIGFGRVSLMDNESFIREAAISTNVHSYIMGLPNQYNSLLGRLYSNGNQLSGGQWQKVALARAMFRKGDILFLDEPTSSLDPRSEIELIESIFDTYIDRSVVYITHRLAATRLADEIIVMNEGKIVERGSHNDLINLKGEYFNLYETQKEWYLTQEKEEVAQFEVHR